MKGDPAAAKSRDSLEDTNGAAEAAPSQNEFMPHPLKQIETEPLYWRQARKKWRTGVRH
jgi:hypothetical protein